MGDSCSYCGQPLKNNSGLVLHQEKKSEDSDSLLGNINIFRYLNDGDDCHLECYVELCVDKAIEKKQSVSG